MGTEQRATVAIAHTTEKHRSQERVLALVREALDHLGGMSRFVRPGQTVLIKPNQAGTLQQALDVIALAQQHGWGTVVSARSGETEETWLADLAVGSGAGQIKVGSTMRSERTAKWNRLLVLERFAGLPYAGPSGLAPFHPS